MKQVCVLGNGQLGRMLRQAGEPLGIAVWPVGLEADPEAVPFQQSVITAEIERWPVIARRCSSNWLIDAPFCVQWPLLCTRGASSLISSPSAVTKHSIAITPT